MGKQPYRVLQVVAVMDRGGTETMLMNHYRALDRSKVQFDFLVHTQKEGAYDKEILSMGGRIFHAPLIRPWSYISYFNWLKKFFSDNGADFIAVHSHIQENSGFALSYAKKAGIDHRLMTSHIAPQSIDYKFVFRCFANLYAKSSVTDRLACGYAAGRHLYGKRSFQVINNAIDTDSFIFNDSVRNKMREEMGIHKNEILIGHVGRFNPQKNHKFIIQILSKAIARNASVKAALVGDGYMKEEIKRLVDEYGLDGKILFLGNRPDVSQILQAFDVYLMPSLYEGLPVSVVEAQAAGLPCVLSDTIDRSCDVTGNVRFLPLNAPVEDWCDAIEHAARMPRRDTKSDIVKAGYDVHENLKILLPLYGIDDK